MNPVRLTRSEGYAVGFGGETIASAGNLRDTSLEYGILGLRKWVYTALFMPEPFCAVVRKLRITNAVRTERTHTYQAEENETQG